MCPRHMAHADRSRTAQGTAPLTAETVEEHASESFKLLGNQTRMAILLALWEAEEPYSHGTWDPTEGNTVSFAELRKRVGMRDSGQFNYHLGKLEGHFVEDGPDGYQLRPAGKKIVRAVIASAGFDEASLEPTEIDLACTNCGSPTAVTFQNQRLYHVCTACEGEFVLSDNHPPGVLSAWLANPAALRDRTPEEVHSVLKTEARHHFSLRHAGICPECSGRCDPTLDICEDHRPESDQPCPACGRQTESTAVFVCTVCKHATLTHVQLCGLSHPAVISFFYERGIEVGHGLDTLARVKLLYEIKEGVEPEVVSTDPPRVRVPFRYEGDELALIFDKHLDVVEVSEPN